jgi:hypothetical protein
MLSNSGSFSSFFSKEMSSLKGLVHPVIYMIQNAEYKPQGNNNNAHYSRIIRSLALWYLRTEKD